LLEFSIDSHVIHRAGGDLHPPIVDLRNTLGITYHPAVGVVAGVELGYGTPAIAIPKYAMKVSVSSVLPDRFTGSFAYSLWSFDSSRIVPNGSFLVHIFNPTLSYELTDAIELAVRWWTAYVSIPPTSEGTNTLVAGTAHSIGLHGAWHMRPSLTFSGDYTYGVSLDTNPTLTQLFTIRSHVVAAGVDWRFQRELGVHGVMGLEHRLEVDINIPSLGAGFYARW
jgi:hypothetical protein